MYASAIQTNVSDFDIVNDNVLDEKTKNMNDDAFSDFKWNVLQQMKEDLTNIADINIKKKMQSSSKSKKNSSSKSKKDNGSIRKKINIEDDNILDTVQQNNDNDVSIALKNECNITNENADKCYFCLSEDLINSNNGLVSCTNCGTICRHVISHAAEWRFYGNDDNKSSDPTRCGSTINELLPQSSMGSMISMNTRGGESFEMRRIRECHGWGAMPYRERSLYNVFTTIQLNAINHGIAPCIIEDAKRIFKKIYESKISRGDNRQGLIASTISTACKARGVPRSPKEIADMFNLEVKKTTKGCKKSDRILELASKNEGGTTCTTTISKPRDFISRFCSKLNISEQILTLCNHILDKTIEYDLASDNAPPSIAAGTIYLACVILNIQITKKEISQACKISEVTISKCFKKLNEYKTHIIPEEYLSDNSDSENDDN
jgi:transcription initiation factor TFIIIB Brf1 subunit/transcription initiation factor TFIIB